MDTESCVDEGLRKKPISRPGRGINLGEPSVRLALRRSYFLSVRISVMAIALRSIVVCSLVGDYGLSSRVCGIGVSE